MNKPKDFFAETEQEFRDAVEEIAYYQGDVERTTIDNEWTESELKDDIYDEANHILNGFNGAVGWIKKHEGRALKDPDMLKPEYIVEDICERFDIIEVYNKAVHLHRNDKPRKFGIVYFDELVHAEVNKMLKNNLVS